MRAHALVYLYRRRLRVHAAQELLAALGVAIAVALVFAVLVADGSIAGSATRVVRTVIGPAQLQLHARGPDGFPATLLGRVERLPGVRQAAPALEQPGSVASPGGGRMALELVGADVSLGTLDGLAHTLPAAVFTGSGIALTRAAAARLGVSRASVDRPSGASVLVTVRGRARLLRVSAILGAEASGALSQAQAAVMPLAALQRLAGLEGRLSRILVQSYRGGAARVHAQLARLAGAGVSVERADAEVGLLREALGPSSQASAFFAAIAALLGLLFAFNALLLTVPERRQAIADLRIDGARRVAIAQMVLFQALSLGIVASLAGLAGGYALCSAAFHEAPGYLAQAFVLGGGTVIGPLPVLLALGGGILATCLASAVPLLDLRRGHAIDAVYFGEGAPGNALRTRTQRRLSIAALSLLLPAVALFVLVPQGALGASVLLALATVLAVPVTLAGVLRVAGALARGVPRLTTLPVALVALRATTLRSLALAATGAIALFGSVALGGARADLLAGLHRFARSYSGEAALWVLNPLDTAGAVALAPGTIPRRIARVRGVRAVEGFQSQFADIARRRIWIIAQPPTAPEGALASEIVAGGLARAEARLRSGGWVAVSAQLAAAEHTGVGGTITIPTPSGSARLRVAATTTNLGWTSGGMLMSTRDYSRLWGTSTPSALGVQLAPGADLATVRTRIVHALGPAAAGLEVIDPRTRLRRFDAIAGEGLARLGQIADLLAVAAVLALAAALGSAIWERRRSLSGLRLEGASRRRLRRLLRTESALMIGAGALTGVAAGVLGQVVIDGYLARVTGFPVARIAVGWRPAEMVVIVVAAVLLAAAPPTWSAARVCPSLALEME
jgi:putative ABC transport system permease protein